MDEMKCIRIGVKVKGKWTYRRYATWKFFSSRHSEANWQNEDALHKCIENACYWAYVKTTGSAPAAGSGSPIFAVDAITVNFGG